MSSKETELKLALAPAMLERLKRHPVVREHRLGRPATLSLRSTYYDTPDRRLAQHGITVRIRLDGKALIHTVKTAGTRVSGLFSRNEWEQAIPSPTPDRDFLASVGLPLLADKTIVDALIPLFSTQVKRSTYILRGEGWVVELALDLGNITAAGSSQDICEAELELVEGAPHDLLCLAKRLTKGITARLLVHSKSDRGHALAEGRRHQAMKAPPLALSPDMNAQQACRVIVRNCLHHLLGNEAALVEYGDPEAIHQMRVALRRLRSAFRIFRPMTSAPSFAETTADLSWLLGILGPSRDAHVFLSEIIDPTIQAFPHIAPLGEIRADWEQRDRLALQEAVQAASDPRFTALLLTLAQWVETAQWNGTPPALPQFASQTLERLWRRMHRAAGPDLTVLDPEHLHRVRIMGKRLRYAGEFFAALYGRKTRAFLSELALLQDCLGELNDIAASRPRLALAHPSPAQSWAAGMISGWHESRRPALLARTQQIWAGLRRQPRGWKKAP